MAPFPLHRTGVALGLSLFASCLLTESTAAAEEGVSTNLIVFVTRNNNDDGVVRCGLFKKDGWLKDAFRASIVPVSKKRALCVFKDVPPGEYGISAYHDEDSDNELDTNLVGYPVEEYCASNNARNMFSAPSWSKAKFRYKGGSLKLTVDMK